VNHNHWLHRPLPQSYLNYASADVALIHALYNRFTQLRYITPVLSSQSELYITTWKHHQPASYETHWRHPLLPLGVLNSPDTQSSTISCTVCNRELAGTAFPTLSRNFISERRCWVCRAVAPRVNNNNRRVHNLGGYYGSIQEQELEEHLDEIREQEIEQEQQLEAYLDEIREQDIEREQELEAYLDEIREQELEREQEFEEYLDEIREQELEQEFEDYF